MEFVDGLGGGGSEHPIGFEGEPRPRPVDSICSVLTEVALKKNRNRPRGGCGLLSGGGG